MDKVEISSLTAKELYDVFLKHFDIREIVSRGVYRKYLQRYGYTDYDILARFDKRLLETLVWIRTNTERAMTMNTWMWGGRFDERGLRDTSTEMTSARAAEGDAWLSSHVLAGAADYTIEGQSAPEHRDWLEGKANELPHPIRLEDKYHGEQISWVHIDVCEIPGLPKVYRFNVG